MELKRVATIDDIIFENADPVVTLAKGSRYNVEAVTEQGVILMGDDGDRFMIDFTTFENGFEAISG